MSRGFVLVEVSFAYLILTLAVTALVPVFLVALRANKNAEKIQAAAQLSRELLEEVRLRKWDENSTPSFYLSIPSALLGPDTGETAGDKRTFDDVDDFAGWTEAGVKDPIMRDLPAYSGYSRTVAVEYVDSNLATSGTATDFKKVTACSKTTGLKPSCLSTVLANR